jgi:hypothetical protein
MTTFTLKASLDSTDPDFAPLCDLVEGLDPNCQITRVNSRKNGKKGGRWSSAARRNQRYVTLACIADGRRKASEEKVLEARKTLIEAGQGHRINGAAARFT